MLIHDGGGVRVSALDAGTLRLDGGAMFGVVPRPLWSRRIEPDDRNRIPLAMRCLLVQTSDATVLVDTGLGAKESAGFREIHGVENDGRPTRLEDSLRRAGVEPEGVDVVLNTHLHFDHAGGDTRPGPDGRATPAFPRARYLVRRDEWETAHSDNPRIRPGYHSDDFDPLREAGVLELLEADGEVAPGVRVLHTPGHTAGHQSVLVSAGEETVLFPADLAPTRAHVALPWIMAYDQEPLVTLEHKRRVLSRAAEEGWLLVFEHDPAVACARAVPPDGGRDVCGLAEERVDEDRAPTAGVVEPEDGRKDPDGVADTEGAGRS